MVETPGTDLAVIEAPVPMVSCNLFAGSRHPVLIVVKHEHDKGMNSLPVELIRAHENAVSEVERLESAIIEFCYGLGQPVPFGYEQHDPYGVGDPSLVSEHTVLVELPILPK